MKKCKDCSCCKRGWFQSVPDAYVCTGVKEPFVIDNYVDAVCTAYPENNDVSEQPKCKYVVAYFVSSINVVFRTFDTRAEATLHINECACGVYTPIANEPDSQIEVNCNCRYAYAKITCGDQFWYWKLYEVEF